MQLYNQSLRVQFSQNSSQQTPKSNLNDSSNSGQRSMSRNNSSSAGLCNRGGQTRQEFDQQQAASMQMPTMLPPSLMNFMAPMLMMQQAQQQQQQQPNAFHRFLEIFIIYQRFSKIQIYWLKLEDKNTKSFFNQGFFKG